MLNLKRLVFPDCRAAKIRPGIIRLLPVALLGLIFFPIQAQEAGAPFYIKDGDRVVFYGDSITEQHLYTSYAETYVVTRFPNLNVSFVNSGWGGDRVFGGAGGPIDTRLNRDVFPYQPTVVTIMLGMNDGGYRPSDPQITADYEHGYQSIVDELQSRLPGVRLTLIQPSPYDDVTQPPGMPGGYNAVLQTFAQFVKDLAARNKQTCADLNAPVVAMLTKAYATDKAVSQNIIPGRVHPAPSGHLIMAEQLLKAWNAPAVVTQVEIDAKNSQVVTANETKVSGLKTGDTISWDQLDNRLPFPVAFDLPTPDFGLAVKSSDFLEALDQETLKVTGLSAPNYQLTIDGANQGVFTAAALAAGINLATLQTPMTWQAQKVKNLIFEHNEKHFLRWRSVQVPLENNTEDPEIRSALATILKALDRQEQVIVAQAKAAAQPVPHQYELTAQK